MKLHFFPGSTTSRPILLFCADHDIPFEPVVINLMAGEHMQEPFSQLNPGMRVPVLEEGDFVLTESSAILRYLASLHAPETYPQELRQRALVDSRMAWLNSGFYMDFGYNLIYPQTLAHERRPDETVQAGTIEWGREKSKRWLSLLDQHIIGAEQSFLCGDQITIADYLASGYLSLGELIGEDLRAYPNVTRFLDTMKARPKWPMVHEALQGWAASLQGQEFTRLS